MCMKLTETERHEPLFDKAAEMFGIAIRLVLNVLMVIVTLAVVVGIIKAGAELVHAIGKPLEVLLQDVLLDTVFILALLEITITILGYLKDGHVHVRYIVDTVLVIMLNEIVSMWFSHPSLSYAIGLSVIVAVLAAVRFSFVRFSPSKDT